MTDTFEKIQSEEILSGASALVEVSAMARVGVLSAGAEVTAQRATQLDRDALRLERRGKAVRATQLRKQASTLREVKHSMNLQREREQIRPLEPAKDTALVQGRASKSGKGKAGLTVSLVGADGTVLDSVKSGANGAFILRRDTEIKDAQIVVGDIDGTNLGVSPLPHILRNKSLFVDLPMERLKAKPDGPDADEGQKMPELAGQPFTEAAKLFEAEFQLAGVKLVKSDDKVGLVIEQSPAPGTQVKRGQKVELQIGTGEGASDFSTALILVHLDPSVIEAGIDTDMTHAVVEKLGLTTFEELGKIPQMRPARLAQVIPRVGTVMAKTLQTALKRVLAQFPNR